MEKQWLDCLGNDRDWFIGWICFGNAPTHDPASMKRYLRCTSKLSEREIEECRVVSQGNTIDVIRGGEAARIFIADGMKEIERKYSLAWITGVTTTSFPASVKEVDDLSRFPVKQETWRDRPPML